MDLNGSNKLADDHGVLVLIFELLMANYMICRTFFTITGEFMHQLLGHNTPKGKKTLGSIARLLLTNSYVVPQGRSFNPFIHTV